MLLDWFIFYLLQDGCGCGWFLLQKYFFFKFLDWKSEKMKKVWQETLALVSFAYAVPLGYHFTDTLAYTIVTPSHVLVMSCSCPFMSFSLFSRSMSSPCLFKSLWCPCHVLFISVSLLPLSFLLHFAVHRIWDEFDLQSKIWQDVQEEFATTAQPLWLEVLTLSDCT